MAAKRLWTEVHRPKTLDSYVFQTEKQREQVNRMVAEGDIPHLLLSGTQGSGKTTLARILISELEVDEIDVLEINASEKTGIDYLRDTLLGFAESYPLGKFKVIHLEEFDYMSHSAQAMLKSIMETSSDTCRFIATCNNEHKIIVPLKSRFQQLRFKTPSRDDVLIRMAEILIAENVEFEPDVLDRYVSQAYPDMRKIINNLQLNTANSFLGSPSQDVDGDDYQFKLLDLITAGNLRELRKLVSEQCTGEQLMEVYEFLYKNLDKHPKFKDRNNYEQGLLVLLDGVYKHGLVAIPHLNFEATCIKLGGVIKE